MIHQNYLATNLVTNCYKGSNTVCLRVWLEHAWCRTHHHNSCKIKNFLVSLVAYVVLIILIDTFHVPSPPILVLGKQELNPLSHGFVFRFLPLLPFAILIENRH